MGTSAGKEVVVDEAVFARPSPPEARRAILAYQGYRQRNVEPATHLGLPSPYLTLIFTLDEPLRIAQHVDRRRPGGVYGTLAGGLHTSPAVITHDGAQSGIQILVHPLAARALFGLRAGELVGYDGEATEVFGTLSAEIHDRVRTAGPWPQRFAVLDDILARVLRQRDDVAPAPPPVSHAWRLLNQSRGSMPVAAIADAVGYSDRYLTTQFTRELGLTPKVAARVIRFDGARRAVQHDAATGPVRLGAVAARCGYYDQSHLVRDFVDFAGRPPSRWLAEEFANVQAADSPDPADFGT